MYTGWSDLVSCLWHRLTVISSCQSFLSSACTTPLLCLSFLASTQVSLPLSTHYPLFSSPLISFITPWGFHILLIFLPRLAHEKKSICPLAGKSKKYSWGLNQTEKWIGVLRKHEKGGQFKPKCPMECPGKVRKPIMNIFCAKEKKREN